MAISNSDIELKTIVNTLGILEKAVQSKASLKRGQFFNKRTICDTFDATY